MKKWGLLNVEKICNVEGKIYLKRYRLIDTPYFHVFLHRIFLSDSDRDMHSHPWWFYSALLWGSYIEHTPQGNIVYKAGDVIYHKPSDWHYLELEPGMTVTSLVITGPKVQEWGFNTSKGFVHHKEYKDAGRRC